MPQTILVVDDEHINRMILANMLHQDYQVLEAGSGESALALLQENCPAIAAVLLDIHMPGMDGYELLRWIRENARLNAIPVILVTAASDAETEEKALALGAYALITAPYSSALIRRCLRDALARQDAPAPDAP